MNDFQQLWALLRQHGSSAKRETECAALWATYPPEMQQRIYDAVREAQQRGDPISPNPYFAIEDTALRLQRKPRMQKLSYADYYARYHTTEPRDGWQMANPTGQKVIYVRNG